MSDQLPPIQLKSIAASMVDCGASNHKLTSSLRIGCDSGFISSTSVLSGFDIASPPCTEEQTKQKSAIYVDSGLCLEASEEIARDETLERICFAPDENGDTQLHLAICGRFALASERIIGFAACAQLLDLQNIDGRCAMHYAALTGQCRVIDMLRRSGAKTHVRDNEGNTPLHLACANGDLDAVRALTCGMRPDQPEIDERNYNGEHCVHIAAGQGDLDVLGHLVLVCRANVNAREGRSGQTPLHMACERGDTAMVRFLLADCADRLNVDAANFGRLSAFAQARRLGDVRTMEALRRAGATPIEVDSSSSSSSSDEDDEMSEDEC